MDEVFLGSESLRAGAMTRGRLRWHCAKLFPDVYQSKQAEVSLHQRTVGALLWSGRQAVISGRAAAAVHGALWVGAHTPIELISSCSRPPAGIVTRREQIADDEIVWIAGIAVTTPARTAFDLARHLPRNDAVRHLDALARATGVDVDEALSLHHRYPRARNARNCRGPLILMDGGAQSPRETWLRLLVIDEGFPRPQTQVRVSDGLNTAFIDMGWEEHEIGLDYDGKLHQTDRGRFVHDIGRNELIDREEWIDLHVVAEHTRAFVVHRLRKAWVTRGLTLPLR